MWYFRNSLIVILILLAGCGDVSNQPGDADLEAQRLDRCSYQSAVYLTDEFRQRLFGDASASCYVIRDGRDEITMTVALQREYGDGSGWFTIGPPYTTPKKRLPAGQSAGYIGFSHIKTYEPCNWGNFRAKIVIRSYVTGTDRVAQITKHIGLETAFLGCD